MKPKTLLVAALLGMSPSVFAKPMFCGYVDHLHVASNSIAHPTILGDITSMGDVKAVKISTTSFDISDKPSDHGCVLDSLGTVTVKFATSQKDYCIFHITDGSARDNPDDKDVQCVGHLGYLGMTYDGFGSFSYSMIFKTV